MYDMYKVGVSIALICSFIVRWNRIASFFFFPSVSKRFYRHTYAQCESRGKESLFSLSLSRLFYGNTSERIKVKNQGLSEITAICISRDKLWLVGSWFQEPLNYSSVATRFPLEYQRLLRGIKYEWFTGCHPTKLLSLFFRR